MAGQSSQLTLKEAKMMQDRASVSSSSNPKTSGSSHEHLVRKEKHQGGKE